MLKFRRYDTTRTDLRVPGQPIVGQPSARPFSSASSRIEPAPTAPAPSVSPQTPYDRYRAKRLYGLDKSAYVSLNDNRRPKRQYGLKSMNWAAPAPPDEDDGEEDPKPKSITDLIVWKIWKIGRPRSP